VLHGSAAVTFDETLSGEARRLWVYPLRGRSRRPLSQFEYVTVLFSLVVAFGVSELLAGWGRSYRNRTTNRPYPLQLAASGLLLLALLQSLWGYWGFREVVWTFWLFLVALAPLLVLAAATFLITPSSEFPSADAEAHYFDVAPAVFALLAAWVGLGAVAEAGLVESSFHLGQAVRIVATVVLALLSRTSSPRIHWVGLGVLVTLQIAFVRVVTPGLS
jgi:hypothetical protein